MSARRPRVLLDVDGPLTRGFFEVGCAFIREVLGIDARYEDVRDWDIRRAFKLSESDGRLLWEHMQAPRVARRFRPNPGALEFVTWLRSWAEALAVTAPFDGAPTWAHDRECWLSAHLDIGAREVYSCRCKGPVRGDALVDDRPEHLRYWQEENPAGLTILWREPHNAGSDWTGPSVAGYEDLRRYLEALRP